MLKRELSTRHIVTGVLLSLLLLLLAVWQGYRSSLLVASESEWVKRTYQVLMEVTRVQSNLDRAVGAQRLYGETGLPAFAREAARARQAARRSLGALGTLVQHPQARESLRRLEPLVQGALAGTPGVGAAQTELGNLLDLEERLLRGREAQVGRTARRAQLLMALVSLLAVLLMLLSGLLLRAFLRERRASGAAIREGEARNRALVNAIPDILMTVTPDGTIRTFKPPAHIDAPDWERAMVGRRVQEVLPADVATVMLRGVRTCLQGNRPQQAEFTMSMSQVRPELPDVLDFEARFVPVLGQEALVISRDITDSKRVLRLKNEFVSTVSHELRTPLTAIRGTLSLLAGGVLGELPPRGRKLVDIALGSSERLIRLINDILDIEKIESDRLEFHLAPVDLGELLDRVLEENRAYAQQDGVRLERAELPGEITVRADAGRLAQVLTNLISNAVKFSPRGAAVTLSAACRDGHVRVNVRDAGPGVPPAFRGRIFQRFAQADMGGAGPPGGTGLGLSISKAIVERHGGTIGFEDAPGGGTVFFFELPLPEDAPAPPAVPGPARRVLVCEDNRDVAYLLQLILQRGGIASDLVHSAEDAGRAIAARPYDALILDLLLPGKDGLTFLRELRRDERTARLPVVVVSASADEQSGGLNGDAVPVIDWINKPIDEPRLLRALDFVRRPSGRDVPQVLHVEDDSDLREVVGELLRGTAVTTRVSTLAAAREQLRRRPFDLVLLDVHLPDGNGLDLLPALRRAHPPVPVLVFSAEELGPIWAERVAAALVKSRTSDHDLLATIERLIGRPAVSG